MCLILNNYNTNTIISKKVIILLFSCAIHRFNLVTKDILEEHEDLLKKINNLMITFKTLLLSANLANLNFSGNVLETKQDKSRLSMCSSDIKTSLIIFIY